MVSMIQIGTRCVGKEISQEINTPEHSNERNGMPPHALLPKECRIQSSRRNNSAGRTGYESDQSKIRL